jgi:hypothetical protein
MLAVEEAFASCQGYDADQRRRLTFIARTYLEHEWAGPRSDVSLLEHDKSLGFAGHDRVFPEGYAQITDRLAEGTDIQSAFSNAVRPDSLIFLTLNLYQRRLS